MKCNPIPDQSYLQEVLNYDANTGVFMWRKLHRGVKKSLIAGHIEPKTKYLLINLCGKIYRLHRLAWVYVYGSIDDLMEVDHINGIRGDNRIENLRLVTKSENSKNKRLFKNSTTGVAGVHFSKKLNKYQVQISVNKKDIFIGLFHNLNDAAFARRIAEIKYGFHDNHGSVLPESFN